MASFFRRQFNGRTLGLGVSMGSLGGWTMTNCEEAKEETKPIPKRLDFVGVFLDEKSQNALKEHFGLHFPNDSSLSNVILKYNPSKEELETFAPILGKDATVKIQAYAEDEHTQAGIAAVSTEHGDVNYAVDCPHVTISFSGEEGFSRAYSNVLLERLQSTGKLSIEDTEEGLNVGISNFDGDLPAFESKLFPFYSPYPSTSAKLKVLDEPLVLTGILCTNSTYDAANHSCKPAKKAECGFCVFMKAGPCGKEFTAWEACLDESKRNGDDFLQVCGPQTLALRDCVDANPEYYSVLNGDSDDDEEDQVDENTTEKA